MGSLKTLDRVLQRWRIAVAAPWIAPGARVLDVGCADGALFSQLRRRVRGGVGLDPEATHSEPRQGVVLIRGTFPEDAPDERFEAVTMLAVLEHLAPSAYASAGAAAARALGPGGRLIVTVPQPVVDRIVEALQRVHLVDGMSLEEHHGFATEQTAKIFEPHGFRLVAHRRFQLGLNNLFVFERHAT